MYKAAYPTSLRDVPGAVASDLMAEEIVRRIRKHRGSQKGGGSGSMLLPGLALGAAGLGAGYLAGRVHAKRKAQEEDQMKMRKSAANHDAALRAAAVGTTFKGNPDVDMHFDEAGTLRFGKKRPPIQSSAVHSGALLGGLAVGAAGLGAGYLAHRYMTREDDSKTKRASLEPLHKEAAIPFISPSHRYNPAQDPDASFEAEMRAQRSSYMPELAGMGVGGLVGVPLGPAGVLGGALVGGLTAGELSRQNTLGREYAQKGVGGGQSGQMMRAGRNLGMAGGMVGGMLAGTPLGPLGMIGGAVGGTALGGAAGAGLGEMVGGQPDLDERGQYRRTKPLAQRKKR